MPPATPAAMFRRLRVRLGLTQAETAIALGVSQKAVESYEQGWREIPDRILKQLLTFLVLKRGGGAQAAGAKPCWEITRCPARTRARCMCGRIGDGRLCWLVSQSTCRRRRRRLKSAFMACLTCPVLKPHLDGAI